MISFDHVIRVLEHHFWMSAQNNPAGVSVDGRIPKFGHARSILPPICHSCSDLSKGRSLCAEFYAKKKTGYGEAMCPFGIVLYYYGTDNAPAIITLYMQVRFVAGVADDLLKTLPRTEKKILRQAARETVGFHFAQSDLNDTRDKLRRVLETLLAGQVAASMRILTHQLLTPVQGAINDIEQLKAGDSQALQRLEGNVDEIENYARQIHVLLSENLHITTQSVRHVNVRDVVRKVCARLESQAGAKNLEFRSAKLKQIWDVEAAPDLFEIVLRCLLENATKYSFAGSPEKKRHIDIRYNDVRLGTERALEISIQSYGCPITQDEITNRKIFELGYRGIYSGDRGRQGTGSGLYVVNQILAAHHGKIDVQSRPDDPTPTGEPQSINTFIVSWPKFFTEAREDD